MNKGVNSGFRGARGSSTENADIESGWGSQGMMYYPEAVDPSHFETVSMAKNNLFKVVRSGTRLKGWVSGKWRLG